MAAATPTPAFDPDSIYSNLVAHAAALHASYTAAGDVPTAALLAAPPGPTSPPSVAEWGSTDNSNSIYEAMAQWASSMKAQGYVEGFAGVQAQLAGNAALVANVLSGATSLAAEDGEVETPAHPIGLLSHYFENLPHAFLAILTILLLSFALFFALFGARSVHVLANMGKKRGVRSKALMGGGLGGLIGGILLGGVIATLSIVGALRNADGTRDRIQPVPFIAITAAAALVTGLISGRFKWVGRGVLAVLGGFAVVQILIMTFGLSSLTPRLIILAVVLPIFLLLGIFPAFPKPIVGWLPLSIPTRGLIVATAATAGWIFVIAVDIWITTGWVDGTTLIEVDQGVRTVEGPVPTDGRVRIVHWDEASFKGLLAAAWLITAISIAWQSWRYKEFGEDTEEQWDKYLSNYISEDQKAERHGLNDPERAGSFVPPPTIWDRLFGASDDRRARTHADVSRRRLATLDDPWTEKESMESTRPARRLAYLEADEDDDADESGTLVGSSPNGMKSKISFDTKNADDTLNDPITPPAVKFGDSPRSSRPASWSRASQDQRKLNRKSSRASGASRLTDATTAVSVANSHGRAYGYDEKRIEESDDESDGEGLPDRSRSSNKSENSDGVLKSIFGGKKNPAKYDGLGKSRPHGNSDARSARSVPTRPTQNRHDSIAAPEATSVPADDEKPKSLLAAAKPRSTSQPLPAQPADPKADEKNPYAAVPATPSLINALERINQAQRQARAVSADAAPNAGARSRTSPRPIEEIRKSASVKRKSQVWDSWWSEVVQKAGEADGIPTGRSQ